MTEPTKQPWEPLEGEPNAAYVRFLMYRNLGPARSVDAAYTVSKGNKRRARAPGAWREDSVKFRWVERAQAWDVFTLTEHGQRAVVNFVSAIEQFSLKVLETLAQPNVKPRSWDAAIEAMVILGQVIPPETAAAVISYARASRGADKPTNE